MRTISERTVLAIDSTLNLGRKVLLGSVGGLALGILIICRLARLPADERSPGPIVQKQIDQFIEGAEGETGPHPMKAEDIATELTDPWADLVLKKQVFP